MPNLEIIVEGYRSGIYRVDEAVHNLIHETSSKGYTDLYFGNRATKGGTVVPLSDEEAIADCLNDFSLDEVLPSRA